MTSLTDTLSQIDQGRQRWSRLGEHWSQGPRAQVSGDRSALAEYVRRVHAFESAIEVSRPTIAHDLRRLYYSRYVRRPQPHARHRGVRLDSLIAGVDDPPVWRAQPAEPSSATLDYLYNAPYVDLPAVASPPVPSDIGAVLTAIDGFLAGASDLGLVAEYVTGVAFEGIATWVGDLACWFLEWYDRRIKAEHEGKLWSVSQVAEQLTSVQKTVAPLELMLGSFDGQALAAYYASVVRGSTATVPLLSDTLAHYYSNTPPQPPFADHPHVPSRFTLFVQAALPPIPHAVTNGRVVLDSRVRDSIQNYVSSVATFFRFHGPRDREFGMATATGSSKPSGNLLDIAQELASHNATIQAIAEQFVELLQTGLTNGQAPASWPRAT